MKKGTKIWIAVGAVIVVFVLHAVSGYNGLVLRSEGVDGQWAQVETQYQRRLDLIPRLVESVRGIMKQEQAVFEALAEARTRYAGAASVAEKAAAASQIESAFGRLLVVMENYPELRSAEAVQTFMAQLEGTENRIAVERGRYNDKVRALNVSIKRFPTSILASMFGFEEGVYFESNEGAENAPEVQF